MKVITRPRQLPDLNTLFNSGWLQHQKGKLPEAKAIYEKVLAKHPAHSKALHLLGIIALDSSNPSLAIDLITRSIESHPDNAAAYASLGKALNAISQPDEAINCYNTAISLRPNFAEVYYNKANLLQFLNRLDEAVISYDLAIEHHPQNAGAYYNKGHALFKLGRLQDAIDSYDSAISLKNDHSDAYLGRGLALFGLNQIDDAIDSYNSAINLNPKCAEAFWNKSIALLITGNYLEGWQNYEWRWKLKDFKSQKRNFTQPTWLGKECLRNQTILLYAEQGLGDIIQFSRFTQKIKEMGAIVLLESPKELINLFKTLKGVDQLIKFGTPLPAFDYQCPLMSLPLALNLTIDNIPFSEGYLSSDYQILNKWNLLLGPKVKPRLGIAWSGNKDHKNDRARSLKLSEIISYLPQEFECISLQKEIREYDNIIFEQSDIKQYSEYLENFSDTASLCELMDVIISVDTSVAHLAGALGKRTCVLLPFQGDWRWLFDCQKIDSPWYKSLKLYRQDQKKEWPTVLTVLKHDLQSLAIDFKNASIH
jgi:tetratricopeptide (TPR) repeat protein